MLTFFKKFTESIIQVRDAFQASTEIKVEETINSLSRLTGLSWFISRYFLGMLEICDAREETYQQTKDYASKQF